MDHCLVKLATAREVYLYYIPHMYRATFRARHCVMWTELVLDDVNCRCHVDWPYMADGMHYMFSTIIE